jgi:hypothetical protein
MRYDGLSSPEMNTLGSPPAPPPRSQMTQMSV